MTHVKDSFSNYMMNFFKEYNTIPGMKDLELYHMWKGTKCPPDNLSYIVFWNSLTFIKVLGLVFFIFLAIINIYKNGDFGLISNNKLSFFYESLLFGVSILIPLILSLYLRKGELKKNPNKFMSLFLVLFIVFFVLNYILEASGFWGWAFNYKIEQPNIFIELMSGKNTLLTSITGIFVIIILYTVIIIISAANFINKSSTNVYEHVIINPMITFVIESLVFGAASAAPVFYMANNRGDLSKNTTIEFVLATLKFSVLFYVFQYSGLWEVMFQGEKAQKFVFEK